MKHGSTHSISGYNYNDGTLSGKGDVVVVGNEGEVGCLYLKVRF